MSEAKNSSPIRIIDQHPDALYLWQKVERLLAFRKTYMTSPNTIPDPSDIIHAARLNITGGWYASELRNKYCITTRGATSARNAVEKTLYLLPETAKILLSSGYPPPGISEREQRVLSLYQRFQTILEILDGEKETASELAVLLNNNPHVEYLIRYFATGKSVADLISEFDIEGINTAAAYRDSADLANLVLGKNQLWIFHRLSRCLLFTIFRKYRCNWEGSSPAASIARSALQLLETRATEVKSQESRGLGRETQSRLSKMQQGSGLVPIVFPASLAEAILQRFSTMEGKPLKTKTLKKRSQRFFSEMKTALWLVPVLHLSILLESIDENNSKVGYAGITADIPGITLAQLDPYTIDTVEYFQAHYRQNSILDITLRLAKAYILRRTTRDIAVPLQKLTKYKSNTLTTFISFLYNFLENVLLMKTLLKGQELENALKRNSIPEKRRLVELLMIRLNQERQEP